MITETAAAPKTWRGRFYEDFDVGDTFRSRLGRTQRGQLASDPLVFGRVGSHLRPGELLLLPGSLRRSAFSKRANVLLIGERVAMIRETFRVEGDRVHPVVERGFLFLRRQVPDAHGPVALAA